MADRYLKATGNWANDNTWSATDGGAAGASFPVAGDNVFITANGNGLIVTIASVAYCADILCSGNSTATICANTDLIVTGDVTFLATMALTGTAGLNFADTGVLTSNAVPSSWYVNVLVGGSLTLADAFTTTGRVYHSGGIFNTAGFAVNAPYVYIYGTDAKTLTLGASVVTTTGNLGWTMAGSNLTITANTAVIDIFGTGALVGGAYDYNGATFNLKGTAHAVSGTFTCLTLRRMGTATQTDTVTFAANSTVTCTNFAIIGNSATNRLLAQSSVLGSAATITATNQAFSNVDFMDITLTTAYDHTANLLGNDAGFERGDPPTGWTAEGEGFTIARSAIQEHGGVWSLLATRNGTDGQGAYYPNPVIYRGMSLTFAIWVYATEANRARPKFFTGASYEDGAVHSGGSTFELLTAVSVMAVSPSFDYRLACAIDTGDTSAYFDDALLLITGTIRDGGGNKGIIFSSVATLTTLPLESFGETALRMSAAGNGTGSCIKKIVGLTKACTVSGASTFASPAATKIVANGFALTDADYVVAATDLLNYDAGGTNLPQSNDYKIIRGVNLYQGLTFIAKQTYDLSRVSVWLSRFGNPGTATLHLWDTTAGVPVDFNPKGTSTVDGNALEEYSGGVVPTIKSDFIFDTPVALVEGNTYGLTLHVHDGTSGNRVYFFGSGIVTPNPLLNKGFIPLESVDGSTWVQNDEPFLPIFETEGVPYGVRINHTFTASGVQTVSGFMIANADGDKDMFESCFITPLAFEIGDAISLCVFMHYVLGT
jgi:hypothetical protein